MNTALLVSLFLIEVAEFDSEREEVDKLREKLAGTKEALDRKRGKKEGE